MSIKQTHLVRNTSYHLLMTIHNTYLYWLRNKYKELDDFKVFKIEIEKQCNKQIKIVRSDQGGEFYGGYINGVKLPCPFVKFLQELSSIA